MQKQDFIKRTKIMSILKIIKLPIYIYRFFIFVLDSLIFFILLNFYFIPEIIFSILWKIKLKNKVTEKAYSIIQEFAKKVIDIKNEKGNITRWQIIKLATKSMYSRKNRTIVTIAGMAIGVGTVVFLLSIGYGAEQLVKSRVATLDEVKQANISTLNQNQLPLNNEFLTSIESIAGVTELQPLVSIVGKVEYNNSAVDVVVYATSEEYLKHSDITLKHGSFYKSENNWKKSFENPDVIRYLDEQKKQEEDKKVLGLSDTRTEEELTETPEIVSKLSQELGLSTLEILELVPEVDTQNANKDIEINFLSTETQNEAVVSEGFLKTIGLDKDGANVINKTFNTKLTLIGDIVPQIHNQKLTSNVTEYKIVGVIVDSKPIVYIPLNDVKTLGVENYSQVRLVANQESKVNEIREIIQERGYNTQSVLDTLDKIESLFSGVKASLFFLGILALSVAALGMFNTLTVSLLERTHEVGLLKAMGMKTTEVKQMFLAESLILGFFGGILGLFLGFMLGFILDTALSIFSISAGIGSISITYVPFTLVTFVILLSFTIGIVTGIYPSSRATKISALDALRYE